MCIRLIAGGILLFSMLTVTAASGDELMPHRDPHRIQLLGNMSFEVAAIRKGLLLDADFRRSRHSNRTDDEFLAVLEERLLQGFQKNGFFEAHVVVSQDPESHSVTVHITEGPEYKWGDVRIEADERADTSFLTAFFQQWEDVDYRLTYKHEGSCWSKEDVASMDSSVASRISKLVQYVADDEGLREFKHTVRLEADASAHLAVPVITVTNAGYRPLISNLEFAGLEFNTPEQLATFLDVKPGTRYSAEMRDRLSSQLLDSGHFLHVTITPDLTFGEDHAVPLRLMVREYDRAPRLDVPLNDAQEAMRKLALWLSQWSETNDDIRVRMQLNLDAMDQAIRQKNSQSSRADLSAAGSDPSVAFQQLPGTDYSGTADVDLVISSRSGILVTLHFQPASGQEPVHSTVYIAADQARIIDWNRREKWDGELYLHGVVQKLKFSGLPAEKSPHRGAYEFSHGINWHSPILLRTLVTADAAAVMELIHSDVQPAKARHEGNLVLIDSEPVQLAIDRDTGRLDHCLVVTEEVRLEVKSAPGLLQAVLQEQSTATAEFHNCNADGHNWSSLATFLAPRIRRTLETCGVAAAPVVERVLQDSNSIDQMAQRITDAMRLRYFPIPGTGKSRGYAGVSMLSTLGAILSPSRSALGPVGEMLMDAISSVDPSTLTDLTAEIDQDPDIGALNCLMTAHYFPPVGRQVAAVGLTRMDADRFIQDLQPFLEEPSLYSEILRALILAARSMTDDESELIADTVQTATQSAKKSSDSHSLSLNLRPLLVLIRSQPEADPMDVLRSILRLVWDEKLRTVIESRLTQLTTPATPKKVRIREASFHRSKNLPTKGTLGVQPQSQENVQEWLRKLELDLNQNGNSLFQKRASIAE